MDELDNGISNQSIFITAWRAFDAWCVYVMGTGISGLTNEVLKILAKI